MIAQGYAYGEWARIALDVANQYGNIGDSEGNINQKTTNETAIQGDYFEFGSEGLNTLCNFLTAFHLNGNDKNLPKVRFFAFDVFGNPEVRRDMRPHEISYFKAHKHDSTCGTYFDEMQAKLKSFGIMEDRVELIQGYFKDTLDEKFKTRMRKEKRSVGFAFLDCNIPSSYQTVLDFIVEFIHKDRVWIYLDEYFQFPEIPKLFQSFCDQVYEKNKMKTFYIRTAGSFGALFKMMRQ